MYAVVSPNGVLFSGLVETIPVDLANPGWTQFLPRDIGIDAIVHLAQSREFRRGLDGASSMVQVNVAATTELLSWARQGGVAKFCLASTGNVYGSGRNLCSETDPSAPEGIYALTKQLMESIALEYANDISLSILRLFGVYGPGQRQGLVPSILEKVRSRQEIVLLSGDGLRINPIYVDDCVECMARLLEFKSMPTLMNIAGGEVVCIRELAMKIGVILGVEPVLRRIDGRAGALVGDTAQLQKHCPKPSWVNLEAGLKLAATPPARQA